MLLLLTVRIRSPFCNDLELSAGPPARTETKVDTAVTTKHRALTKRNKDSWWRVVPLGIDFRFSADDVEAKTTFSSF